MKKLIFISLLLAFCLNVPSYSQSGGYRDVPSGQKRAILNKTDFHKIGLSLQYEQMRNNSIGWRFLYKAGSDRQLFNFGGAVGFMFYNSLTPKTAGRDFVTCLEFPFSAFARLNFCRKGEGNMYFELEPAVSVTDRSTSKYRSNLEEISDSLIVRKAYCNFSARIGYVWRYMDVGLYCRYDIAPALNQKHIYEDRRYDYYAFGPAINERFRIGLSVIFFIYL